MRASRLPFRAPSSIAWLTSFEDLQRLGWAQFRAEPHRQALRADHDGEEQPLQAELPRHRRLGREVAPSPQDQGADHVAHRVALQVGREPRGDLAGVGEGQHLPAPQRREVAVGLRARRLDLKLAGDQRLERLVALGLVVLHRRAPVAGAVWPHTPQGLNSPSAEASSSSSSSVPLTVSPGAVPRDEHATDPVAEFLRVEPPGDQVEVSRLGAAG